MIDPLPEARTKLTLTACWHPQEVSGLLYRYARIPAQLVLFRPMTAALMRRAEV